jgi:hypothetical protein
LFQSDMVRFVKEMEMNALFPDGGVKLHRHINIREMDVTFPDSSARHEQLLRR